MGKTFGIKQSGETKMTQRLGIGDRFPDLTVKLVGGGSLDLPAGLEGKYRVILFYRGHW